MDNPYFEVILKSGKLKIKFKNYDRDIDDFLSYDEKYIKYFADRHKCHLNQILGFAKLVTCKENYPIQSYPYLGKGIFQ